VSTTPFAASPTASEPSLTAFPALSAASLTSSPTLFTSPDTELGASLGEADASGVAVSAAGVLVGESDGEGDGDVFAAHPQPVTAAHSKAAESIIFMFFIIVIPFKQGLFACDFFRSCL
jgi:hypothetical protein